MNTKLKTVFTKVALGVSSLLVMGALTSAMPTQAYATTHFHAHHSTNKYHGADKAFKGGSNTTTNKTIDEQQKNEVSDKAANNTTKATVVDETKTTNHSVLGSIFGIILAVLLIGGGISAVIMGLIWVANLFM